MKLINNEEEHLLNLFGANFNDGESIVERLDSRDMYSTDCIYEYITEFVVPFVKEQKQAVIDDLRFNELLCEDCKLKSGSRIVGQAFTAYTCARCEKEQMHHNTGCPRFCKACALGVYMCQRCGVKL